jgi:hypothetical protein
MKLLCRYPVVTVVLLFALTASVESQNSTPDPFADETPPQKDARMKWWREARFGMFIHWGVYSVPAGTYEGKQIPGIGEWIMNRGKIPMAQYRDRPGGFQVLAEVASLAESRLEVVFGEQQFSGATPNTGDNARFRRANLGGTLDIKTPGSVTVSIKPVKESWTPLNLRTVTLRPVVAP